MRRSFSCLLACALLAKVPLATAEMPWMSQEAMRADFVGETLRGYYRDGTPWTASYGDAGRSDRYEVGEGKLRAVGTWYFRDRAFCFFYGPPVWPLEERCVATIKVGANCYEFHLVWPDARAVDDG